MKRIPNPVCKCGHRKRQHEAVRPTECKVRKCDCARFVKRPSKHQVLVASADYGALAAKRGEVCWICGSPPGKRRLHIDHDHAQMYVRGLLCFRCNVRLERGVTSRWLRDAADYLDAAAEERVRLAA